MRPTWVLTVASESTSSAAISAFEQPARELDEHLALARGQQLEPGIGGRAAVRRRRSGRRCANESSRRRVTLGETTASPRRDGADAGEQVVGRHVLQQEAARAGAQAGERVLVEVEGRQDDHARAEAPADDLRGRLDAVHARHAHVHQHDVGIELGGQAHGLAAVARLADDDEVVLRLEHHAEAHPQERLVVDEQDARRHASPDGGSSERRACTRPAAAGARPGLDGAGVDGGALAHAVEPAAARLGRTAAGPARCR